MYFYLKASEKVGLGHLYRSLSLALILKDTFDITFHIPGLEGHVEELLDEYHIRSRELDMNLSDPDGILVIDCPEMDDYNFFKSQFHKVVLLNDIPKKPMPVDLICNHGFVGNQQVYEKLAPNALLALGPSYALLRPEFYLFKSTQKRVPNSIFISMGGADAPNYTQKLINSIPSNFTIHILIGSANPNKEKLKSLKLKDKSLHFHHNLNSQQIVEVLGTCQMAITASSGISYEVSACRTPLIFGITTSDQRELYESLKDKKVGVPLDHFDGLTEQKLQTAISQINEHYQIIQHNQSHFISKQIPLRIKDLFAKLVK